MSDVPPAAARLRRTVEPYAGEDPRSVAVRYAGIKRLTVSRLLGAGLGMARSHLTSLPLNRDRLEAFADLAGLDLQAMTGGAFGEGAGGFRMFGHPADADLMVPHRRRVAPGMLRADPDPWIRAWWQVACLPCDPDTGESLLHICPGCGTTLSWSGAESVHRCQRCSLDLRDVEPRQTAPDRRASASLMVGVLRREPPALSRLHHVVARAPAREQMAFFTLLGALRPAAAGAIVPAGAFAAFRGLGIALAYPGSFDGIVKDMLAAYEERDPRFGRLVGGMEILARTSLLPPGKIKNNVQARLRGLLKKDVVRYFDFYSQRRRKDGEMSALFEVSTKAFLIYERSSFQVERPLSGLGDTLIQPGF